MTEYTYETDILIVGSGSAGLWAAHSIKQKNKNVKVLMVDKGPENWGGLWLALVEIWIL